MKHAAPTAKDLPDADIDAVLAGDVAAFRRFYLNYDPVVRWAVGVRIYRWPRLVPIYEDIVQDVWAYLVGRQYKTLRYYKRQGSVPFWRFVAIVSSRHGWRLAKRYLRRSDVEVVEVPDIPEDEELSLVARMLSDDLVERLLVRAQECLDAIDLALLEDYYVNGETIRDVAQRLGIQENAAYQRHRRLRKKLAALLEELLGERPQSAAELVATLIVTMSLLGGSSLAAPSYGGALARPQVEVSRG
jgi:RNA polymerase sigma factor (sigma-70 family)